MVPSRIALTWLGLVGISFDVFLQIVMRCRENIFSCPIQWLCLQFYEKSDAHTSYNQGEQKGSRFLILCFDIQSLPFLMIRIVFDLILIDIGLFV